MQNVAFERVDRCCVLVQNQKPATDEEWENWVGLLQAAGRETKGALCVLVVSAGGSPTPKQRARIHSLMPSTGGGVLTAIVTSSFIGRTVVSTMGLFNDKVRAFAPGELGRALEYLGVEEARRADVRSAVERLHTQLALSTSRLG
jgi:hypothetical protein